VNKQTPKYPHLEWPWSASCPWLFQTSLQLYWTTTRFLSNSRASCNPC